MELQNLLIFHIYCDPALNMVVNINT